MQTESRHIQSDSMIVCCPVPTSGCFHFHCAQLRPLLKSQAKIYAIYHIYPLNKGWLDGGSQFFRIFLRMIFSVIHHIEKGSMSSMVGWCWFDASIHFWRYPGDIHLWYCLWVYDDTMDHHVMFLAPQRPLQCWKWVTFVPPGWSKSIQNQFCTGWWFEPLWRILVNWDDYSQYMGK